VLLSIFCSVLGQLSAGGSWDGTWSNTKLGGGSLYICTDKDTSTAHGTYGNIGLFSGYLLSNTLTGYWYEAGYDRPFGAFQLTISDDGNSFSGSWSYFVDDLTAPNGTKSWTGSKSSGTRPDEYLQCLFPADLGSYAQGVFGPRTYLCDHTPLEYLDSRQPLFSANFDGFSKVEGYSPDSGNSLLLSDFYFPDDDDANRAKFRPENYAIGQNITVNDPANSGADDDDSIFTSHIVVGRFVTQSTFCGWFWYGFYGKVVNTSPICFNRTEGVAVDPQSCAYTLSDIKQLDHENDDGNTSQLIANIQAAFDALALPEFNIDIVKGDGSGTPPANAKDVNGVQYVAQFEYQCNSASVIASSIAALFALVFAF